MGGLDTWGEGVDAKRARVRVQQELQAPAAAAPDAMPAVTSLTAGSS
jgi:hypothetical protein